MTKSNKNNNYLIKVFVFKIILFKYVKYKCFLKSAQFEKFFNFYLIRIFLKSLEEKIINSFQYQN